MFSSDTTPKKKPSRREPVRSSSHSMPSGRMLFGTTCAALTPKPASAAMTMTSVRFTSDGSADSRARMATSDAMPTT